jgi:hypothetical protein
MSNIIELKSTYDKVSGQEYYIYPCKNPETYAYPEFIRATDANGQMILSEKDLNEASQGKIFLPADEPIVVKHGTTFNLDNAIDAAKWEAIKHSKMIAPDRFAKNAKGEYIIDGQRANVTSTGMVAGSYGIADLYVEHPGALAQSRNAFRRLVAQATTFVMEDSLQGRVTKCKLLEKDMSRANANDVEDYLMTLAEKTPQRIINIYTGGDTVNRLLVIEALEKHIVIKRDSLLIYADNVVLGASLDAAVEYLSSPAGAKVKDLIMRETYPDMFKKEEKKAEKK